jgi:hypothetical protein
MNVLVGVDSDDDGRAVSTQVVSTPVRSCSSLPLPFLAVAVAATLAGQVDGTVTGPAEIRLL